MICKDKLFARCKIKYVLFIIAFIMLIMVSCSKKVQPNKNIAGKNSDSPIDIQKQIIDTEQLYDFEMLYSYKNISLSDTDKIKELVNQLQYAKEFPDYQIEYTKENKEMLRINYVMKLTPGQEYKVNHTKWMADAVILFSLIDDLEAVEYSLVQDQYGYGGVPINREKAEETSNADINYLGKTEKIFLNNMPKKIDELQWDPDVMSIISYDHVMGLDN